MPKKPCIDGFLDAVGCAFSKNSPEGYLKTRETPSFTAYFLKIELTVFVHPLNKSKKKHSICQL
ncbi:hypothetical protein A0U40_12910 [[Bacillus] sp. KCTC 13219]|nr:hypothetical protein A0U40_12910 [[Bacillus] sp. KCTC 13219]